MFPTCHPSHPSVSAQSPESPTSLSHSSCVFHSNSRPNRLTTRFVHVALRPTRASGTHRVASPSRSPHRASLSLSFPPSDKRSLLFVECFIYFLVHLPFVLCFLFVYGPEQPLPFVMDTVDSFPLMTTCRYTLTLRLIVSEQWPDHPLSWHCALHQADLICHLPFMPSLGLVTSYMYIYSPVPCR
jgi:hypothetical protein